MTDLLVLCLSFIGFMALALGMERHHGQFARGAPGRRVRWMARMVGIASIALSLAYAVDGQGAVAGTLLWAGLLTPAALAVTALLAWREAGTRAPPRNRAPVARALRPRPAPSSRRPP